LMLLGQALFATAQYDEAAGATAMAMQSLPPDKWGAVLENYQQLYGHPEEYASQLRALQKARDAKPDSPALHFLLGFHYGFSGHPGQAIAELGETIQLEPKDQMAKALRDQLTGKLKGPAGQNPAVPFNAPGKASRTPQLPGGGLR
jgi:tetratricopeptide (TPR) repeat protein